MNPAFTRRAACWPVAALLLWLVSAQQVDAARRFTELGAGRGLDVNVAVSLLIDRDGLLWVGSREGLFRYDGYQATPFLPDPDHPGSISDQDVRALYEAADGALWVSTNTGGLNRRDPRTGKFTQFHHDSKNPRTLSDESIYGVAEDADGRIWVGTQNGLNRLDADGRSFVRYFHDERDAGSLAHNWVYALHRGASRRLWIGTVGGGIDRWDDANGKFEHFPLAQLAGGSRALDDVFAIHEAPDGRVWAGTREGLVVLDPARRTAKRFDLAERRGCATAHHHDARGPPGRLWVATLAHGVLVVDLATGEWTRARPDSVGAPGNLPAQPQLSLASNDHMLFVGTWGSGVYRAPLDEPVFRLLAPGTDGGGLRDKNVTAVLGRVAAGQPWVGSFGGGPQLVDVVAGTVAPTGGTPTDSIRQAGVLSFAVTRDGSLFAGYDRRRLPGRRGRPQPRPRSARSRSSGRHWPGLRRRTAACRRRRALGRRRRQRPVPARGRQRTLSRVPARSERAGFVERRLRHRPGAREERLRLGRHAFERSQSLSHRALVLRAVRRSQRRRPQPAALPRDRAAA